MQMYIQYLPPSVPSQATPSPLEGYSPSPEFKSKRLHIYNVKANGIQDPAGPATPSYVMYQDHRVGTCLGIIRPLTEPQRACRISSMLCASWDTSTIFEIWRWTLYSPKRAQNLLPAHHLIQQGMDSNCSFSKLMRLPANISQNPCRLISIGTGGVPSSSLPFVLFVVQLIPESLGPILYNLNLKWGWNSLSFWVKSMAMRVAPVGLNSSFYDCEGIRNLVVKSDQHDEVLEYLKSCYLDGQSSPANSAPRKQTRSRVQRRSHKTSNQQSHEASNAFP